MGTLIGTDYRSLAGTSAVAPGPRAVRWRTRVRLDPCGALCRCAHGHVCMAQSGDVTVPHASLGRSSQVWYGVHGNVLREPSDGQRSAGVRLHHGTRWRPWHAK
jgi:hypothetical protein